MQSPVSFCYILKGLREQKLHFINNLNGFQCFIIISDAPVNIFMF